MSKLLVVIETWDSRSPINGLPHRRVRQLFLPDGTFLMELDELDHERLSKRSLELEHVKQCRETLEREFAELRTKFEAAEQSRNTAQMALGQMLGLKEQYRFDLAFARRHGFKKLAAKKRRERNANPNGSSTLTK